MTAHLYLPGESPRPVSAAGFTLPDANGYARVPAEAASLLGCAPGLVDVLDSGANYVVYTIFDSEDTANLGATQAAAALASTSFDTEDEDELLRGPVLIVRG